jgi:MarR family transcriptional regulator, lower aerobic nicotinate degradation pathway regulator
MPMQDQNLSEYPGHYIRRLHQIATAAFMHRCAPLNLTPVQFAALKQIANQPGCDQRTLASAIDFDTSTIASVLDRLQQRGWIERKTTLSDKRVKLLFVTAAGRLLLKKAASKVLAAQADIVLPLSPSQQKMLMGLLHQLVVRPELPSNLSKNQKAT